ncbi:MAG: GNAT family N-acetyltransferase [Actinomycetota bacterium]
MVPTNSDVDLPEDELRCIYAGGTLGLGGTVLVDRPGARRTLADVRWIRMSDPLCRIWEADRAGSAVGGVAAATATLAIVELRNITMDDMPLYEGMLTDPEVMAELGGPLSPEGLGAKLRGIVQDVEAEKVWYSVIVEDGADAGTVCIWSYEQDGQTVNEIGWMLRPEFQGRGLGTGATRALLDRARAEGRWGVIHAHPGVTNGASNAICRKLGFTKVREVEVEYMGRPLQTNDWVIDLRASS